MSNVVSGSFTGTGTGTALAVVGKFNISLSGFGTGTVQLQRSFDDGTTWLVVSSHTADVEDVKENPEYGVLYRFECTAHTAGTIAYRISR